MRPSWGGSPAGIRWGMRMEFAFMSMFGVLQPPWATRAEQMSVIARREQLCLVT